MSNLFFFLLIACHDSQHLMFPHRAVERNLMKSRRTKSCEFSQKTRKIIKERDGHCCIFCGSTQMLSIAHLVPRSRSGLGIESNGALLCAQCHFTADQGADYFKRKAINDRLRTYLQELYPEVHDSDRVFHKYGYYRKDEDDESDSEQERDLGQQVLLDLSGYRDFV